MNDDKIPHIEDSQMKKLGEVAEGDYVLRHHRGNWRYLRVDRATRTQITAGGKKYLRSTGYAYGEEYGPTIMGIKKETYENDLEREKIQPLANRVRVAVYAAHAVFAQQAHHKIDPLDFAYEVDDLDKKIDQLEALLKELVIDVPERIQERYRQRNASR